MIERRDRPRLALEPGAQIFPFRNMLGQNLHRNGAVQPRVARLIHLAHATRAERGKDFVRAELVASRKGHELSTYCILRECGLQDWECITGNSEVIPVGKITSGLPIVENTPQVHNLLVCTLCSCYPWPVLGLPPVWYKSAPYRSRSVIDPRGVLLEFGLELPEEVEVRVWDSTAEVRYLVLPQRPEGSEKLSEEALAALVTRDSMIGVAKVVLPQTGERA